MSGSLLLYCGDVSELCIVSRFEWWHLRQLFWMIAVGVYVDLCLRVVFRILKISFGIRGMFGDYLVSSAYVV